ncbi:MAG: hypothetical protein J0L93_09315 [Deltaproteobacteria bacterium]|nr:hypothetical protein [Deltaproteobacteria bacterium]
MKQISILFVSVSMIALSGCGGGPEVQVPAKEQPPTTTNYEVTYADPVTLLTLGDATPGGCSPSKVEATDLNVNDYNKGLFTCSLDLDDLHPCKTDNLRAWIGHSTNGGNTGGFPREQAFAFTNLVPEQIYSLKVYFSGNNGAHTTKAFITEQAQIISGSSYTFDKSSWTCMAASDAWEIKFKSSKNSATIKLSNDLTAGGYYFYPDFYAITKFDPALKVADLLTKSKSSPEVLLTLGSAEVGVCSSNNVSSSDLNVDNNDVSLSTCALDLNNLKSCPKTDLRSWIGHADSYKQGFPREQAFTFSHLTPDQTYSLKVYFHGNVGAYTANAYLTGDAELISGGSYKFSDSNWVCLKASDAWEIKFKATGSMATIRITNGLTSGRNLFKPDLYILTKS